MQATGGDAAELELVQLGSVDVDPGPLNLPGTSLMPAIGGRELDQDSWAECRHSREQLPATGWRVVSTRHGQAGPRVLLAAPHPGQPAAWALIHLSSLDGGRWFFSADPGPVYVRPGRPARRRYLRLDWPRTPVVAPAGQPLALSLRLTNTADTPWTNGPDLVRVLAWILHDDTGERLPAQRYFASSLSDHRPVELAAGQSLVLPACLATLEPELLPPGCYGLTALLTALNLRSARSVLHLT
jgi:hypothetical protein